MFLFVLYDNWQTLISIISVNINDKNNKKMRKTIITIEYVEKSTRFANCPNTAIIKIWQGVFFLLVKKR